MGRWAHAGGCGWAWLCRPRSQRLRRRDRKGAADRASHVAQLAEPVLADPRLRSVRADLHPHDQAHHRRRDRHRAVRRRANDRVGAARRCPSLCAAHHGCGHRCVLHDHGRLRRAGRHRWRHRVRGRHRRSDRRPSGSKRDDRQGASAGKTGAGSTSLCSSRSQGSRRGSRSASCSPSGAAPNSRSSKAFASRSSSSCVACR